MQENTRMLLVRYAEKNQYNGNEIKTEIFIRYAPRSGFLVMKRCEVSMQAIVKHTSQPSYLRVEQSKKQIEPNRHGRLQAKEFPPLHSFPSFHSVSPSNRPSIAVLRRSNKRFRGIPNLMASQKVHLPFDMLTALGKAGRLSAPFRD